MDKRYFPLADIDPNPLKEFKKWLALAEAQKNPDVEAMTLATVTPDGKPSARMVLFKGLKNDGFVFYTNYESNKSQDLKKNPHASLVFFWPLIYRQVRVGGSVSKLTRLESEDYFRTRPRESQIAAWSSKQSAGIHSLEELDRQYKENERTFAGKEVPCPPFWGGYRVEPTEIEFWLGQEHRMHHRFVFTKTSPDKWSQSIISP